MEFSGEKLTFKRIFNYIFGLFLITLGVAFSIKSGLGSTPVASIPYALNLILNIDLGITTFMFQIFLVILQLILLRRNLSLTLLSLTLFLNYCYIGTILGALFIGSTVKLIHKIYYKLTGRDVDLKKCKNLI